MNGTNLQESLSLHTTLCSATTSVLETMFFTEAVPVDDAQPHIEPVSCKLHAGGAVEGSFSVAIDRAALLALGESFYGDVPTASQPFELLCEFTNMIAGSTLSLYSPSNFCPLSSPQLCEMSAHLEESALPDAIHLSFVVDGGLMSIACSLRTK